MISMEIWLLIIVSIVISLFLKISFNNFLTTKKLPPGPLSFPIIGNLLWLGMSSFKLEPILRSLHAKYGPMVTLRIGSHPLRIFIADRTIAHQALVNNGSIYADRPPPSATSKITTSNQRTITSSNGPTWRLLRRNITAEILHSSRVKSYSDARKWVLQILQAHFEPQAKSGHPVCVMERFRYAIFCLLVRMCVGDKLDEKQIKEIEEVQGQMLLKVRMFRMLNYWPRVTKIVLRNRWQELFRLRKCQEDVWIPLIRERKKAKEERITRTSEEDKNEHIEDEYVLSYVDTLLDMELPEEKRKLEEGEMVSLCSEFLIAGTDTTSTALLWIMANLVKYPQIQEKLFLEIKGVVRDGEEVVKEDELQKMPYLKAIILEGLRRHPPVHYVLPHAVTEDVLLSNYMIPKDGIINFMVAEMGWDPKVWEDPMGFKPERFLKSTGSGETFDITGSKEIKMMPFGVGRRICPAYSFAMLHLEYFIANLIWKFEWKAVDGSEVDFSEKGEFTVVMKNPLQAKIFPRSK